MENSDLEKNKKMNLLHEQMDHLIVMLDSIDPEKAGIEDIDRIIVKLDELEKKCQQYRNEWT
ncbi:SE1561 family protein [Evansella tamaricis]|uniref:Uncharacterized protein n=1 Tax=Evansella tamaricis TaxID=2069301 RepID=A0ABS6JAF7_9BACI|nr:SE1561 family protein [Evansella tamaricis]MBU9710668.1 hypothetical protein [Evansella tamaricis]